MEYIHKNALIGTEYIIKADSKSLITMTCTDEHMRIKDAFPCREAFPASDIKRMEGQVRRGTRIHASVCIKYYNHATNAVGTNYLGSCFETDVYTLFESDIHGYLPQMIEEATEEAQA